MRAKATHSQIVDLLRHLDDLGRLEHNPLVTRWRAEGADVWECVNRAILCLPEPVRTIIVRCDLARELHSVVAADLGISVRHFYRRRRQALEQLALTFASTPARSRVRITDPEPMNVVLSHATALQNVGQFDEAVAVLEKLRLSLSDTDQQARIACRLADICCSAGRLVPARAHLQDARTLAKGLSSTDASEDIVQCEIETAQINLAWHCRDPQSVLKGVERVAARLRRLTCSPLRVRAAEALVSLLLVLADVKEDRGALGDALATGLEAMSLLDRFAIVNGALRLRCMVAVATVRSFMGGTRGIDDLSGAYAYAHAEAMPRAAANIAANLSGAYKIRGETDRALQFGSAAMMARSVCSNEEYVLICSEVAHTHLIRRDLRSARSLLANARATIPPDDVYLSALTTLLGADIDLAETRYSGALAAARRTTALMMRLGWERYLGSALRIEAEAQEALGHHREAVSKMRQSLDVLETSAHPYVLAVAYSSSARICRHRAHRLASDDLMRTLQV
jgi:tetratricopeptide (TPR) repeat protein